MLTIDEAFVDSSAPNPEAIKNGRGLVAKKKFTKLHRSEDGSLLFGECQGSGSKPYHCSSDFARPDQPVHRCSCPSRQFPCKHCLGLMYAFAQGKPFTVAEVPQEIAEKREKAEVRAEKKKERETAPRKVNKGALAKKIQAQLDGLDLLEKLLFDLVRLGMGNTTPKSAAKIQEQAKQLGDAYLPGAQAALLGYLGVFAEEDGQVEAAAAASRDAVYADALDQLTRLFALLRQGREYLGRRLEDPELKPETDSAIAAWLGHAWELRELREAGLVERDVELLQLAFNTHDDQARREHVDTGIWMNLGTGTIHLTQTFRPHQAVRFIKSDDSFFGVAQVPELCVYPGDVNRRVRWEGMVPRPATPADFAKVRQHAHGDLAAVIKQVKGALKAPLGDKLPVFAVRFARIGEIGDELVMEDAAGGRLVLIDRGMPEEPESTAILALMPKPLLAEQVLVLRFRHDLTTRKLQAKPLALVTADRLIRLTF